MATLQISLKLRDRLEKDKRVKMFRKLEDVILYLYKNQKKKE